MGEEERSTATTATSSTLEDNSSDMNTEGSSVLKGIANKLKEKERMLAKYKSLLKLAKGRIQAQDEEIEKINKEKSSFQEKLLTNQLKNEEVAETKEETSNENILIRVWQRVKVETNGGMEISNTTTDDDRVEIWALFEYESDPDTVLTSTRYKEWKRFGTEQALLDYIRKDNVMGEPISLPPYSLTPDQSKLLLEEAKSNMAVVNEDFRRYRVKAEVARKQADTQLLLLKSGNVQDISKRIEGQDLVKELAEARSEHAQLESLKKELSG